MHNVRQVVLVPVTVSDEAVVIAASPVVKVEAKMRSPAFTTETLELNLDIGSNK